MKVIVKVLIIFMIILGLGFFVYSIIDQTNNYEIPDNVSDEQMCFGVWIRDGKITTEEWLDEFIEIEKNDEMFLSINEYDENGERINQKYLKFHPGTSKDINNENEIDIDSFKESYGYYEWVVNNEEIKNKLYVMDYNIKRRVEDDNVIVYLTDFYKKDIIDLFSYSLDSSGYKLDLSLNYHQRKDLGIKKVLDGEEFDVYEFGGHVTITVDGDYVHTLEDALKENIITVDDILNQAKMDLKYGICEEGYYSDGGSTEYYYPEYTILKYDTLDGNKDLVIGYSGQIINQFNKYKTDLYGE